jgi:hypothetical protein
MVAVVLGLALMVRSTINSATKDNIHSVYTKIFTNHLTMISIISGFNLNWPSQVTSLFSSGSIISASASSIVSFDCWMDNQPYDSVDRYYFYVGQNEMRIVFEKLFIYVAMPVIIAVASGTVWAIVLKV